jgi:hypothetical protein
MSNLVSKMQNGVSNVCISMQLRCRFSGLRAHAAKARKMIRWSGVVRSRRPRRAVINRPGRTDLEECLLWQEMKQGRERPGGDFDGRTLGGPTQKCCP